jgi:methionyl-tRNA formyltransferase
LTGGASAATDATALSAAARLNSEQPLPMRVIYCTRGGFFGALVLHRLRACSQIEICGIVRSSRNFHPRFGFLRGALAHVRRSGIAYSLYLLCATNLADVLCGFGAIGCVPTRTRSGGVPVHTTRDINDGEGLRFLTECAPDLLISAFFDQRLQEGALVVPTRGCVNIHPSLLPSFKGVDPVFQARLQQADVGVTVHYMTPRLDAGEILAQRSMATREGSSIFETTAALFREGAELLVAEIGRIERREHGIAQETAGCYQSWPSRAEIRALRALGGGLVRLADFRRMLRAL